METIQRKWDTLSDAQRKQAIDMTIAYFDRERNEDIGVIAAGEVLDFFLQSIGTVIYDKGVMDAKALLKQRFEDLEVDLDVLLNT